MSGDMLLEYGALMLAIAAVFVATARNRADDRRNELLMQGRYLEMSKEDREEVTRLREENHRTQSAVSEMRVLMTQSKAEADGLIKDLQAIREIRQAEAERHKAELAVVRLDNDQWQKQVATMKTENSELRERVAALSASMQQLQQRMDEVEAQSKANKEQAEALRASLADERAAREKAESERDAVRVQRDALLAEVDVLREQLEAERVRVTEQAEALKALRDELDEMKRRLEEAGKDGQ